MSKVELDKCKLLVNESEVIKNLLMKLCNKQANNENLMKHARLKRTRLHPDENGMQKREDESEVFAQELQQIQRKRDEAMFLKNGIDKRAKNVATILSKYVIFSMFIFTKVQF